MHGACVSAPAPAQGPARQPAPGPTARQLGWTGRYGACECPTRMVPILIYLRPLARVGWLAEPGAFHPSASLITPHRAPDPGQSGERSLPSALPSPAPGPEITGLAMEACYRTRGEL